MPSQKETVTQRAQGCCEYCRSQLRFSPDPFAIEHIFPLAKGGSSKLDNLALSCQGCNNHKYIYTTSIDPTTGQTVPLFHPRQEHWTTHFAWIDNFERVIGLTPTGRATVERLQLNRAGVVNLRQALYATGRHPPNISDGDKPDGDNPKKN